MSLRLLQISRRRWVWMIVCVAVALAALRQLMQPLWSDPVITLRIGETYEYMEAHSTAPFSVWGRGSKTVSGGIPKTDARLRFVDPQYGFETPLARFFTVTFVNNLTVSIRMSPQIEPLLIDDAMKVVTDLQSQWCAKGWKPMGTQGDPTITDTPEWRAYLRQGVLSGRSFWQAGDRYQAMLILGRFRDSRHLDQERYLITLAVAKPWIPFDEIEDRRLESHHFLPPLPEKGAIPCPSQPS